MRRHWLTLAQASLCMLSLGGCSQHHLLTTAEPTLIDAGRPLPERPLFEAGTLVPNPDGGVPIPPLIDAGTSSNSTCEVREAQLSISLSTALYSSEECLPGPIQGWIDGTLREAPGSLSFVLDSCPPTADCDSSKRCQIHIEGSDVLLGPALENYQEFSGWVEPDFLRLQRSDCCRGPGCVCGTVLYLRQGDPAEPAPDMFASHGAPIFGEDLDFGRGPWMCAEACGDRPFAMSVERIPAGLPAPLPAALEPGQTVVLGESEMHARLLSSSGDSCADEPVRATWMAWFQPRFEF